MNDGFQRVVQCLGYQLSIGPDWLARKKLPSVHMDPATDSANFFPTLLSVVNGQAPGNYLDLGILGEYSNIDPSWENVAVSKIKSMMVTEQGLALDTICHFLEEHSQLWEKRKTSPKDSSMQKLLEFLSLDPKQTSDKALVFHLYGLILRECPSVEHVQCHLASLLELSHQHSSYREGIALAVGLASTEHLQEVWALLEHLGRTKFLRSAAVSPDSQDEILKSSFLSAAILLTRSLREEYSSRRYKFTQIPELIQCLLDILKEEPNFLATFFRQKVILVVMGLSNLRPGLKPLLKSQVLQTCLHSVYRLPATEHLNSDLPSWSQAPDVNRLPATEPMKSGSPSSKQAPDVMLVILESGAYMEKVGHCGEPGPASSLSALFALSHMRSQKSFLGKQQVSRKDIRAADYLSGLRREVGRAGGDMLEQLEGPVCSHHSSSGKSLEAELTIPAAANAVPVPCPCQVLYKKTMRALDLLLQNFISENPSMDEICFLLQHTEHWLKSDKSHERCRALQSIFLLLQYVVDSLKLAKEAVPSVLGHQLGLLTLLWRDKNEITQELSHRCVFLLMQLVLQQKGKLVESAQLSKMKHFETSESREWEVKLYHAVKAFKNLTVAQHTQLILTLVHNLGSWNYLRCDLAAQLLLMICEEPGLRKEQVAEILQGLFQELPNIHSQSVQQTISKVTMTLGTQHIQEVVEVVLSLCHPSDRWILLLWRALATNYRLARDVITLLYVKLKLRPPRRLLHSTYQARLVSLMALGTIYELLYTPEYRDTVRWAFAGILLGLLTELYYLLEVGLVDGIFDYEEDNLASKPLGPCRTCLEALKGLFWTNEYWEVFADVKLIQGWELFAQLETFPKGVTLLARAMAHYNCEVKAVLGQALISLKSTEERDNIVAICIITEFLNSPNVCQNVSRKAMDHSLNLGLSSRNQTVRVLSLKGLGSALMQPYKVTLLRSKLMELLDNFLQPEFKDLLGLMEILGHLLHCLGVHGIGIASFKIAQHLLNLFTDERAKIREHAIFLFGDVIHYGGKKFRQSLKILAFQALVPLLFHMADPCPEVAVKAKYTFLRCAILLKWEFRKELFGKLAWGQGPGAENDIFVYMIESNFGSYQQFLSQALIYLDSPQKNLKLAAMRFIGGLLQDYFNELCFYLTKDDVIMLKNYLEALSHDTDSRTRKFYLNHWDDVIELSHYIPILPSKDTFPKPIQALQSCAVPLPTTVALGYHGDYQGRLRMWKTDVNTASDSGVAVQEAHRLLRDAQIDCAHSAWRCWVTSETQKLLNTPTCQPHPQREAAGLRRNQKQEGAEEVLDAPLGPELPSQS
ncbi:maestro heat-like repeat family member 5 [Arvicola amphibius]|uniref:maestro heat-like repeat family member 5 n=1 Tax=Arvicola amphibius TaxID=1047088 RepID=UPI001C0A3C73|nr:maestro heat-like repeat family member 5 [Arvicola amphibius]